MLWRYEQRAMKISANSSGLSLTTANLVEGGEENQIINPELWQACAGPLVNLPVAEFKRRKRHRRKIIENQEVCIMRGVYFKNMKWQAAIKVDKKQIHLGIVSSLEEAARLYDRYF
ncbi:putative transcription factor AP2-EREBP family [Helianthus anomalus]